MSPQEMAAVASLVEHLAKLPIGALLIVALVLPWISILIWTWLNNRMIDRFRDQFRQEINESKQRFEMVVRMYEDNAQLVKNYEKLCGDQQDLIISNTTTMQRLCDRMGQ